MPHRFCLVDGNLQRVGNSMIEPPGLFRGRGDHPKTGCLKLRVMPEQVTINIGEHSPVPKCQSSTQSCAYILGAARLAVNQEAELWPLNAQLAGPEHATAKES